jgi:nitrite reductase (NADH) small subunit
MVPTEEWLPVCRLAELEVGLGASALVHGHAMAIFRGADDEVYAVGNHDPFDRNVVLSRGIMGSREGVPIVGSPRHRHVFDLRTGRCLDDEHVSVPAYEVRVVEGVILVGRRRSMLVEPFETPRPSAPQEPPGKPLGEPVSRPGDLRH